MGLRQFKMISSAKVAASPGSAHPRSQLGSALRARIAGLPLFWKCQIGGWIAHAVLSLPLKIAGFDTLQSMILVTLIEEPLGFGLTSGMRLAYLRLGLRVEEPVRLAIWVSVCCATAALIDWTVGHQVEAWFGLHEVTPIVLLGLFWIHALQYVTWTFLYFWIKNVIAARERVLSLIRAEAAAHEAELRMLRAQINPHFLFNSLNTVLNGLNRESKALSSVVQGLADYLRYSLKHRHTALVPLGDEFDAAMNYLVVEKARFRDGLSIEAHVDEAARAVPVPGVMLQPLIENAVKHGYKSSPVPLTVRISIRADNGGAIVEVANSGRWIEPPAVREPDDASGVGLESLQRRLALLYPASHRFEIAKGGDEVSVRIHLPAGSSCLQPA